MTDEPVCTSSDENSRSHTWDKSNNFLHTRLSQIVITAIMIYNTESEDIAINALNFTRQNSR